MLGALTLTEAWMRPFSIIVSLFIACACAAPVPVGAAEPSAPAPVPTAPVGPGAERQAIVLHVAGDGKELAEWRSRWQRVATAYVELIRATKGYPVMLKGEELGGAAGTQALVVGICAPSEVPAILELVRSVFPEASAQPLRTEGPLACPKLKTDARLHTHKTISKDGWLLVLNIYLTQPMGADSSAQRKSPPDPSSGYLKVIGTLFDPSGAPKRVEMEEDYPSFPDLVERPPDVCALKLEQGKDQFVVQATCDRQVPPCSGNVSRLVERATYRIAGSDLEVTRKVLEKKVEPLCD